MQIWKNYNVKNLFLDLGVIIGGILVAVVIFAALKNSQLVKERNALIPDAKKALQAKDYSKSIALFEKANKAFPDNNEVKRNLGELYFVKGKYDEAQRYFELIPRKDRTEVDDERIGQIAYEKKDWDKVIATWENAKISPQNKYKLAKLYYDKDNFDKYFSVLDSLKEYKEPLALYQYKVNSLNTTVNNLGKILSLPSLGDATISIDLFRTQIVDAKKQLDEGKKDFSTLTEIAAYSNLNQCKLLFQKLDELRKSLELKKVSTYQVDYYQGFCDNQTGKPREAIPLIQNAVKADPTIIEYRESLARSYFLSNDIENLKKTYNDILNIQKASTNYENFAIYLYKLGSIEDSLNAYEQAFINAPGVNEKNKYARAMMQITVLDKKDLEICNRSELLAALDKSDSEQILVYGQCKLFLDKNLDGVELNDSLVSEYLKALRAKDKDKVNSVLDRDTDGVITGYYKAVGAKLLT